MIVMLKKLSNENMKKIVHEIMDKELKKGSEKVYPVTYHEYFNELEDSVKLKVSDKIIHNVEGYNYKGNIVIFLDKISRIRGTFSWKIFLLVENTYHEIRHTIQKKYDPYSYEGFLRDIDNVFSIIKRDEYYLNYNSFSSELGANLYGIQKAKKYIEKHFPEEYPKIIKKIELKEEKYKYDYMMYDTSYNIDRFIIELRNKLDFTRKYPLKKICPILDIFMNSNYTYKKLRQIINNSKFKELDKKIIFSILSCTSFYESIDIEELSQEELQLLHTALKYTYKIYQNQSIQLEEVLSKKIIDNRAYYYNQKNILKKLKLLAEKESLLISQNQKINIINR